MTAEPKRKRSRTGKNARSGPSQTYDERLARGDKPVLVWLGAQHRKVLDNIQGLFGFSTKQAIEYVIDRFVESGTSKK